MFLANAEMARVATGRAFPLPSLDPSYEAIGSECRRGSFAISSKQPTRSFFYAKSIQNSDQVTKRNLRLLNKFRSNTGYFIFSNDCSILV